MKKKVLTSLLCISMAVSMLAGCGSRNDNGSTEVSKESQSQNTIEVTTFDMPTGPEESDIYVEPVDGISDDFIRGMDASAVLSVENSGARYYNFDGEEQDVFETLAQAGVNYIRLRVWNDPYDEDGNGYGGGDNDLATAIELGKRATQYGMKVSIDFHYSDFWADPKKQFAPKAWEDMTVDEKSDALYDYTKESLKELLDAGVNVTMVQVGNEINNGMSGETEVLNVMQLLSSGSKAVREIAKEYDRDIQIVLHYTNIENNDEIDTAASNLEEYGVDYDIFGLSYYPFWDGDNENMQTVAKNLMDNYGKEVIIAETSYLYTTEDGDGFGNSFDGSKDDLVEGYGATVQSQATMIRDICAAANEAGVAGMFYWEGTWIPVGSAEQDNSALWEKYGSGWASSYSIKYDPDDAGKYYGGCSWDNQAMFDFTGHPLASLNVFKYLKYGSTAPLAIDYIPDVNVSINVDDEVSLPEKVDVVYNDRSKNTQEAVTWDEAQLAKIDTSKEGSYTVEGKMDDGSTVTANVQVEMVNYVVNPSFEDTDTSMWNVTYNGDVDPTDYQEKEDDAHSGTYAFHFWSGDSDMDFAIEQEITDLEAGSYRLSAFAQGGDMDESSDLELYALVNGEEAAAESFMLTSWADWKEPVISDIKINAGDTLTIGVRMKCNTGSWGTVDDFTLNKISD